MKDASSASGHGSAEASSDQSPTLQRGLQNRHIQLIALGGAIGTGLFLGIGPAIQGNDSNLLIVFYVQIMPDDFVMQLHRF